MHGTGGTGLALHSITRHMHGLMAGREGARAWRRFLSGSPPAQPGGNPVFGASHFTESGAGRLTA